MKERPILFSGPMVRAILDGRKTQTRRVLNPQPVLEGGYWWLNHKTGRAPIAKDGLKCPAGPETYCPFGAVGDRLWVRETWFCVTGEPGPIVYYYRADQDEPRWKGFWKPSIYMPRWASRITLEITGVRVERLQEISEADAWDEGVGDDDVGPLVINGRVLFRQLWESINGPGSWEANYWVWVIEFERV